MGKTSVLLVDDDRFFRETLGEFLEEQGYEVRRATNGLEALAAVRDEPPDLILLDLIMPKVDGGRVCRYLREDPRFQHIPIVIFSGLSARDIAGLPGVSADAYVAKGPLQIVTKNVLSAIQHLEAHGRSIPLDESVYGYEGFRPRRMVGELLSLKRHYDLLLQTMSEGVLEADEKNRIFYVNPAGLAMLGKEEHELIGASLWEAFGPAYQDEVERVAERLRSESTSKRQEVVISLRGKLLKGIFGPLWDNEAYRGLLIVLDDVTY